MTQSPSDPPHQPPHHPLSEHHDDHPISITRNARYALWLFTVYVIFYGGFVALCTFRPDLMGADLAGVNLAIVYGLGLIVLAFLLALLYMAMCRQGRKNAEGRA